MSYTNLDLVEVREVAPGQQGVFACQAIPAGTVLGVFDGEAGVVELSQLETLSEYWWEQSVHLRIADDKLFYLLPSQAVGIDFLNHSCRPNTRIDGQLVVSSLEAIAVGSQLTADYRTFDLVRKGVPCWCDQPRCVI